MANLLFSPATGPTPGGGQLPTASVSTTIHVEYLSGYLTCLCQVENSVDNVFYARDFPPWLHRLS